MRTMHPALYPSREAEQTWMCFAWRSRAHATSSTTPRSWLLHSTDRDAASRVRTRVRARPHTTACTVRSAASGAPVNVTGVMAWRLSVAVLLTQLGVVGHMTPCAVVQAQLPRARPGEASATHPVLSHLPPLYGTADACALGEKLHHAAHWSCGIVARARHAPATVPCRARTVL